MFDNIKPAQHPACLPPAEGRRTQDGQLKGSIKNTKMEKNRKEQKTALPPSLESCTERQRKTGNSPSPCICSDDSLPIFSPSPGGVSEGATGCDTDTTCTRCGRRQKSGYTQEWSLDRLALNWFSTDICCQTNQLHFQSTCFQEEKKKIHTHTYIYFPFSSFIKLWFEDIYIFYTDMSEAK